MRERKHYCGEEYMEVDIYPYTEIQRKVAKGKRSKKEKESLKTQKNLNDKNARRKLTRIVEANFTRNDYSVTLTYSDEMLPKTIEEAEKEVQNYLRRVKRRREKDGVGELKYILITSFSLEEERPVRIHHHILMNSGLDRDIVEDLWRRRKRKGEEVGRPIGHANADRIQPDVNSGITALSNYLKGNPTASNKRKWTCSQNLERPWSRANDFKYSRRQIEKIAKEELNIKFWEKKYLGWTITDRDSGYEAVYNEMTGWSIYLKLRRIRE